MNKMKKLVSVALIASISLSSINVAYADGKYASREYVISEFIQAVGRTNFSQVGDLNSYADNAQVDDIYLKDVELAVGGGILTGYEDNTLRPDDNIKRVEALAILSRCLTNLNSSSEEIVFEDTPLWAQKDITRLTKADLLKGYGNGTFGANDYLTKEQVNLLTKRVDSMMNTATPQSNFYQYVNGKVIRNNSPYAGYDSWSFLDEIDYQNKQKLKNEVNSIVANIDKYRSKSDEARIARTYLLAADIEKRNKDGVEPIQYLLDEIDSAKNINEYIEVVCDIYKETGFSSVMNFNVNPDLYYSDMYVLYMDSIETGIDKDTWNNKEKANVVKSYEKYVTKVFDTLGYSDSAAAAKAVCDWQKDIAQSDWGKMYYYDDIYNIYDVAKLQKAMSNVDMKSVFKSLGMDYVEDILVTTPKVVEKVNKSLKPENLQLLKDYTKLCLVMNLSTCLTEDLEDSFNDFKTKYMGGTPYSKEDAPNMKTQGIWSNAMGKIYVDDYFDESSKKEVESMTKEIIDVYRGRINNNTWMSSETKKNAIKKLDNMSIKVGYSDDMRSAFDNYEVVTAEEGGSFAKVIMDQSATYAAMDFDYVYGPRDKEGWEVYPQVVNAFYDPTTNSITLPAGILQNPFYSKDMTPAQKWGGIGIVIAHEITHAFDTDGSYYDEDGYVTNWWTDKDRKTFDELTKKVVDYYSAIEVRKGLFVDGKMTVGENIADLGGVSCVLEIAANKKLNLEEIFNEYAKVWAINQPLSVLKLYLEYDAHAPAEVRVNAVLSTFEEFLEAYDIQEGDKMYVDPENRIKVW